LQLSLVLRPVLPLDVFGLVSAAIGLACAEAIEELTSLPALMKWPNDVTVERRKLTGILVESRVAGHQVDVAVAGVGINVSPAEWLPPALARSATSIGAELARKGLDPHVDRSQLLATVLEKIESIYPLVETGVGAAELIRRAADRSEVLGKEVVVRLPDETAVRGLATRLLPSGALEVRTDGRYLSFHVGEIEHLRPV
jgi:BirA family biotin operon repressor/biotin-[acetyl-CoA-carboxylase] ligase